MTDDISLSIVENSISVTITQGATWDGVSGKPTPVAESSFIVSNVALAWAVKTLDQVKVLLGIGAGAGDVVGPATNTDAYIPQWNGADSKTLKNGLAVPDGGLAGLGSDEIEFSLINNYRI
jgi:hypothetical protein